MLGATSSNNKKKVYRKTSESPIFEVLLFHYPWEQSQTLAMSREDTARALNKQGTYVRATQKGDGTSFD